ncbi:unnamed protein product, partial [Clonostachys rhizophaga]
SVTTAEHAWAEDNTLGNPSNGGGWGVAKAFLVGRGRVSNVMRLVVEISQSILAHDPSLIYDTSLWLPHPQLRNLKQKNSCVTVMHQNTPRLMDPMQISFKTLMLK